MAPKRSREEYTNDSSEENRADDADSEDACDSSSDASGSDSDGDDLAFRVADETALEAHKINDIMWSRLRCVTACCVCLAGGDGDDSSERAFLAAKDGPPGFASYPGWLGWLDLG